MDRLQATGKIRKRKAENQDNERLSKRLSLLNLERDGQKLYVPVEQPVPNSPISKAPTQYRDEDTMQLDNTKHKVYIYDIDAELSDIDEPDDGKLVFLPDIQKHLRESRIPSSILANADMELAGNNQLVLYNVPSSLTVPEDKDSVRRAIIETRARARANTNQERNSDTRSTQANGSLMVDINSRDWYPMGSRCRPQVLPEQGMVDTQPTTIVEFINKDLDAMELG